MNGLTVRENLWLAARARRKGAAIAAAIRRLLDNADLHRRIGSAARQSVMQRFSVDQMVGRTMKIYQGEIHQQELS